MDGVELRLISIAHFVPPGGDGMCMGFHGWKEGDFGEDEITN